MSDVGDGIGELGQGILVARAIDGAGSGADGHTHETACLNCGAELVGSHCHQCGQHAHVHRTMGAVFHDILHGVLHLEGRTWSTLAKVALRPGELTRRYIAGERRRFVSPMALFLFSVFLMFAVFSIFGISASSDVTGGPTVTEQLHEAEKKLEDREASLRESLTDPDLKPERRTDLEARVAETRKEIATIRALPHFGSEESGQSQPWRSGWKRFDKGIEKWQKNPGLMLYKLQTNAYKFSWLVIPLSLPFMWLLFAWKRRYGLYDHAVFVTYSLAFMSLMAIVLTIVIAAGVPSDWPVLIFGVLACVHIFMHLRGAYELRKTSTIWRWIVLMVFIQVIIALFATVLVMLGLVG